MRRASVVFLVLALLAPAGCTETDDTVVIDIGTMFLSLTDTDLATQIVEVSPAEHTVQVMQWTADLEPATGNGVTAADLDLGGQPIDLTNPGGAGSLPCIFIDTALTANRRDGQCSFGVVIDADGETRTANLKLKVRMWVRRLAPLDLPPMGDYDGDGVLNASDNCLLIDNPDQTDTGMKGFGDACSTFDFFTGLTVLDNDADAIGDRTDNCPYTRNRDQADAGIPFGLTDQNNISDGIGDACDQYLQTAQVRLGGATEIELDLSTEILQPFRRVSFLTVDFKDLSSLNCTWPPGHTGGMGSCEIDPDQVIICLDLTAGLSCPI